MPFAMNARDAKKGESVGVRAGARAYQSRIVKATSGKIFIRGYTGFRRFTGVEVGGTSVLLFGVCAKQEIAESLRQWREARRLRKAAAKATKP